MDLLCAAIPLAIVATVLGLMVRSAYVGWRSRERWGEVLHKRLGPGDGAYRSGVITERRLRGVPWTVWVAGVSAAGLGPLTGLVFAPAGLVGAAIYVVSAPPAGFGVLLAVAAIDGFALAFGLHRGARALLTCEREGYAVATRIAAWSGAHHALLLAGLLATLDLDELQMVPMIAAFLGALHALLLLAAARRVRDAQATMSEHEREALADTEPARDEEPELLGLLGRPRPTSPPPSA